VHGAFLLGSYRRRRFGNDFSLPNCLAEIESMIDFRKSIRQKFSAAYGDSKEEYDTIINLARLLGLVSNCKTSIYRSTVHCFFENEEECLTLLKKLPSIFKGRIISITEPGAAAIEPNTLLVKNTRDYKYLAHSHWQLWSRFEIQALRNFITNCDCEATRHTKHKTDPVESNLIGGDWIEGMRIRIKDDTTLSWFQLVVGGKWKIYTLVQKD